MKQLALLTDIHGCYKTLQALLAKLPKDAEIIVLGDMVDRGPDSHGVLDWAFKNKIQCVMGNHEHMMVDWLKNESQGKRGHYQRGIWLANGGEQTLESFEAVTAQDDSTQGMERGKWVMSLPHFIIHPDHPNLLLSHTGWGDYSKDPFIALWHREWDFPKDGKFRVFGHTQAQKPVITDDYAMIDTGCAYKHRGMGTLTAMLWPSKEIIQQENIDQ